MKPTIWIFSLEPLETRYTKQWQDHIPSLLSSHLSYKFNIVQVYGVQKDSEVTAGAFLNFSDTNYWKSSQLCKFLEHHNQGETSPDDHILFTDAWNPTIIQLKYMNDLLGFNWKFHGLWHAGSYDPEDFLGRIVGNTPWVRHSELAFFNSFDYNYFATESHISMFKSVFSTQIDDSKIIRSGWPMEYMKLVLEPYKTENKRNLIIFPHRIAPEKQVEIFRDLASHLPQYEFIVCQDTRLTKEEYHSMLGQAKIVFSANLQETLGITTCAEGPLLGVIPFAPNRLSYTEIFKEVPEFLYPSNWTENWNSYVANRERIINQITHIMENYEQYKKKVSYYVDNEYSKYFSFDRFIQVVNS